MTKKKSNHNKIKILVEPKKKKEKRLNNLLIKYVIYHICNGFFFFAYLTQILIIGNRNIDKIPH